MVKVVFLRLSGQTVVYSDEDGKSKETDFNTFLAACADSQFNYEKRRCSWGGSMESKVIASSPGLEKPLRIEFTELFSKALEFDLDSQHAKTLERE